MNATDRFTGALAALPLVAILRGLQFSEALAIGHALVEEGWRLIEVPLNSPEPLRSIEALAAALPGTLVGAGTVLTPQQVRDVHAAGGRLIVSPNFDAEVVRCAVELGMVCLPGVATATEAFAALAAGAHGLKLFPGELITPAVVRALRAVLSADTVLLPVGGITPSNMAVYRAAGADGFGLGSALYKPGLSAAEVGANARGFIAAWRGLRAA
ncbi:MAG: 2-dehydro-3-deoxy-6-phosphogalactonate aldolase [Ramlibacter sp.]|nr:2-dehydro-3-deoxy-6-phosphogalactonate aldolase [Ramlibacter sp.]